MKSLEDTIKEFLTPALVEQTISSLNGRGINCLVTDLRNECDSIVRTPEWATTYEKGIVQGDLVARLCREAITPEQEEFVQKNRHWSPKN